MKLSDLSLEPGTEYSAEELESAFDRGMTGRGIEICYDEDDQRYLRLFSADTGPYADDVSGGQFTYVGEGRSGDQELKAGNRYLANAETTPLPIFFFHRASDGDNWEYQGQVDVLSHEYGYFDGDERKVYRFVLRRRSESEERVDPTEATPDIDRPERTRTTRSRIIRNTALVTRLKDAYSSTCQVCGGRRRRDVDAGYAEGHHLKPLGRPHHGPDVEGNVLVLCPNHHADFDYGLISVDPDTRLVAHAYDSAVDGRTLHVRDEHEMDPEYLAYHNREIADF